MLEKKPFLSHFRKEKRKPKIRLLMIKCRTAEELGFIHKFINYGKEEIGSSIRFYRNGLLRGNCNLTMAERGKGMDFMN